MKSFINEQEWDQTPVLRKWELVLYAVLLGFAFWIMFKTFSYNYETGEIIISGKIWSDFGANLPLIRSFSYGDNWPPEYPIFPNVPIQYHFLFFYMVGMLEKAGLPIHWALNVPSALGFFAILAMIYAISKNLFQDTRVALLSLAFFLFNGSLSFLQFFAKHPLSESTLKDIVTAAEYTAMGPWDGGKVLGVWHLNVFLNQRHFCFALGILMVFIFVCLWLKNHSRKTHLITAMCFGIAVGFFPLLHKPVMLMFAVVMTVFFLALPYLRLFLVVMGASTLSIVGLLWLMSFSIAGPAGDSVNWYPGFTVHDAKTTGEVLSFLWYQYGLHCLLIPIGFVLAPRRAKIFILPALLVFVVAFLFRFSPDILANHKFINFGLIMGQMLSAYALVRIFSFIMTREITSTTLRRLRTGSAAVTAVAVVLFMTLSGIIDMFAVANDSRAGLADIKSNPEARWFYENTPKNAVVLNSTFFHHPATIAGRKIFLGWAYFNVTAGYPHDERIKVMKTMYAGNDPNVFCPLMRENNISYITSQDTSKDPDMPPVNDTYFRSNFTPSYVSEDGKYAIFSVEQLCGPAAAPK